MNILTKSQFNLFSKCKKALRKKVKEKYKKEKQSTKEIIEIKDKFIINENENKKLKLENENLLNENKVNEK